MLSPTIHVSGTDAPWKRQNKLFISSKPPSGCLVSWNIVNLRSFVQIENLQISWCKSASTSDFVGKARCTSTSATTSINLTTPSDNIIKVALFDTAYFKKNEYFVWINILDFKKMNIFFEWIFWILKKWIFCLNEYSGF